MTPSPITPNCASFVAEMVEDMVLHFDYGYEHRRKLPPPNYSMKDSENALGDSWGGHFGLWASCCAGMLDQFQSRRTVP